MVLHFASELTKLIKKNWNRLCLKGGSTVKFSNDILLRAIEGLNLFLGLRHRNINFINLENMVSHLLFCNLSDGIELFNKQFKTNYTVDDYRGPNGDWEFFDDFNTWWDMRCSFIGLVDNVLISFEPDNYAWGSFNTQSLEYNLKESVSDTVESQLFMLIKENWEKLNQKNANVPFSQDAADLAIEGLLDRFNLEKVNLYNLMSHLFFYRLSEAIKDYNYDTKSDMTVDDYYRYGFETEDFEEWYSRDCFLFGCVDDLLVSFENGYSFGTYALDIYADD